MRKIDKMGGNAVDANEVWCVDVQTYSWSVSPANRTSDIFPLLHAARFDDFEVDDRYLIGEEGTGFKKVLFGMNAERVLLAAESLGTGACSRLLESASTMAGKCVLTKTGLSAHVGYAALRQATAYATDRRVFGRAIGQYQGVQHPLAMAWANLEAARHLTYSAARLYDERSATPAQIGAQANAAKLVASEAGYKACEAALMAMGGMGYAREYHVERYLRDSFVPRLAPVSCVSYVYAKGRFRLHRKHD